ncbi:MAG TPA: hypothetical protein ENN19_11715 [Chloroflexi bacterium]|nr:hypothetical protein [Chloroflexota bacterium]
MCPGKAPFDDVSPLVVLRLHADKAPTPPQKLNPDLPPQVAQVLLKALAKDPEERYQSAGEFAGALREGLAAAEQTAQLREQMRRRKTRVPLWAYFVVGVTVVGLVIGLLWLVFTRPVQRTRVRDTDGMRMVYVRGGIFEMGSTEDQVDGALLSCSDYITRCERFWFDDELPRHDVELDDFWLDKTEVTNAQFADFLNDQGNQTEGDVTWRSGCRIRPRPGASRFLRGMWGHRAVPGQVGTHQWGWLGSIPRRETHQSQPRGGDRRVQIGWETNHFPSGIAILLVWMTQSALGSPIASNA